jgi:hypothetical protein
LTWYLAALESSRAAAERSLCTASDLSDSASSPEQGGC